MFQSNGYVNTVPLTGNPMEHTQPLIQSTEKALLLMQTPVDPWVHLFAEADNCHHLVILSQHSCRD